MNRLILAPTLELPPISKEQHAKQHVTQDTLGTLALCSVTSVTPRARNAHLMSTHVARAPPASSYRKEDALIDALSSPTSKTTVNVSHVVIIAFIVKRQGLTVHRVIQLELIRIFTRHLALPLVPQMLQFLMGRSVRTVLTTVQSVLHRQVNAQAVIPDSYYTGTRA